MDTIKKLFSIKGVTCSLIIASSMTSAVADEVKFSYASPDEGVYFVGTKKAELYDVAISLDDPALRGSKIVGIEVPVLEMPQIGDYSAWISTVLNLEVNPETSKKDNAPDVCSVAANTTGGYLKVRFPEPYTIGEKPVYVGYSFNVSEVESLNDDDPAKYPVAVAVGAMEGTLYMHTRRHYLKWGDRTEDFSARSSMVVILDGDFASVGATLASAKDVKCQSDSEFISVPLKVRSYGSQPISQFVFEYSFQGVTKNATVNFDEPLNPYFGQFINVTVDIPNEFGITAGPMEITLKSINGLDNIYTEEAKKTLNVALVKIFPKKRPLVEEYTGLWCGWCPRGYVGMETMNENYEDFIGVAFHNEDPMDVTSEYPSPLAGFPSCYIDRQGSAKSPSVVTLRNAWTERAAEYTPVQLSVTAFRNSTNSNLIDVKAEFSFVEKPQNECRLSYMLLADGLKDDSWEQTNYFPGKGESYMDWFAAQPGKVTGLEFNDVLTMFSPFAGEPNSVPAEYELYAPLTHTYQFDTAGHLSRQDYDLLGLAGDRLRVVALVTDVETGEVLNAAKCRLGEESGVAEYLATTNKVVEENYFDLSGRACSKEYRGLILKQVFFEDGTCQTYKYIRK